jgi:hypothetical protein
MARLNDMDGWLEGLGLSSYREAFHANDVDFDTLRLLTAEDLQQIGVTSVGHRRRMLAAIAELGEKPTTRQGARLLCERARADLAGD